MTVFKNYFKILRANFSSILTYTVIFLLISFFFLRTNPDGGGTYQREEPKIYLENRADSDLAKGLEAYLKETCKLKDYPREDVKDLLFYGRLDCRVTIPKDFPEGEVEVDGPFNESQKLQTINLIKGFLGTTEAYTKLGLTVGEAVDLAKKDLAQKSQVSLYEEKGDEGDGSNYYFNFLSYIILSQTMLMVGLVMTTYKREVILRRNQISPLKKSSFNLSLSLGHILAALVVRAFYILIFKLNNGGGGDHIRLMILNSLVFAISIVPLAVFVGSLVRDGNSLSGALNVVSLGSSFLTGAFVPQELLSEKALKIGRLFPTFYYVENNNRLMEGASLEAISKNLRILLAFGLGFLILSNLVKTREVE